jgi:Xaa-Pro aminopeptidase
MDGLRRDWIASALREARIDALICTLPLNVLMISGYWPVLGTAIGVFTRESQLGLLVPEGEAELARLASPAVFEFFQPGSLDEVNVLQRSVAGALAKLFRSLGLGAAILAIEEGIQEVPVGYSAVHFYADSLRQILAAVLPAAKLCPADELLGDLRAVKTPTEISLIRLACQAAGNGFAAAQKTITPGAREIDVALAARRAFALPAANQGSHRADGFAWCMSGPNSAEAGYAFARSQSRVIAHNDVVLLHANSYLDGYWTDITRTFICGETKQHAELFAAIAEAREAALSAIRPGIAAKDVDARAREVLQHHGLAQYFSHGLGHEVGFGAVNANARPRLHPVSPDILREGMVFNVEPAVYIPKTIGIRHCDVVTVTAAGCEVLTPWLPPSVLH